MRIFENLMDKDVVILKSLNCNYQRFDRAGMRSDKAVESVRDALDYYMSIMDPEALMELEGLLLWIKAYSNARTIRTVDAESIEALRASIKQIYEQYGIDETQSHRAEAQRYIFGKLYWITFLGYPMVYEILNYEED